MIVLAVRFDVKPETADAFLARVRQQRADALDKEPGCKRFDISRDPDNPGAVFLYELYADRAALDAHRATPHFEAYSADVAPMVINKRAEVFEMTQSVDLPA